MGFFSSMKEATTSDDKKLPKNYNEIKEYVKSFDKRAEKNNPEIAKINKCKKIDTNKGFKKLDKKTVNDKWNKLDKMLEEI